MAASTASDGRAESARHSLREVLAFHLQSVAVQAALLLGTGAHKPCHAGIAGACRLWPRWAAARAWLHCAYTERWSECMHPRLAPFRTGAASLRSLRRLADGNSRAAAHSARCQSTRNSRDLVEANKPSNAGSEASSASRWRPSLSGSARCRDRGGCSGAQLRHAGRAARRRDCCGGN